ncbi:MAG TPA: HAMP domain-containing sensor histidine kinase [Puia sp.]|nr:HAMP domain-containing sensor histidine kinase [Puia sp.]
MKLISRYNRFNLPVMILTFLITGIFSYWLIRQVLQNELDKSLRRVQGRIREYTRVHNALPPINSFDDLGVAFEKTDKDNPVAVFRTTQKLIPEQHEEHISRELVSSLRVNGQSYKLTITSPLEGTKHMTRVILVLTTATIFLVILLSFLFNRYVLSKLWKPFYESLRLAGQFKISRPEPIVFPDTQIDEFNFMIDHLRLATAKGAEDYQILKEFTENASHEIQTPLAIIRSKLDLLIQDPQLTEKHVETLKSAYRAIKKLSRLNQSLLLMTKIDNRQFEDKTAIDLQGKVEEKLVEFQELWQANHIEVDSTLTNVEILANQELVDILLNNLLSNATRHNSINGRIAIELQPHRLSIRNTGNGSSLNQARVFKRFYKKEQHSDHNGLGLSIIKQICDVSDIIPAYQFTGDMHDFILSW